MDLTKHNATIQNEKACPVCRPTTREDIPRPTLVSQRRQSSGVVAAKPPNSSTIMIWKPTMMTKMTMNRGLWRRPAKTLSSGWEEVRAVRGEKLKE